MRLAYAAPTTFVFFFSALCSVLSLLRTSSHIHSSTCGFIAAPHRCVQQASCADDGVLLNPSPAAHLHTAFLCAPCSVAVQADTKPKLSIAAGVDYGLAARLLTADGTPLLPTLSVLEEIVISRVRLYGVIVKLSGGLSASKAIKGHMLSRPHDAPEVAAPAVSFPRIPDDTAELAELIQVFFVGAPGRMDEIKIAALNCAGGPLLMRPDVVYAWLHVLRAVNPAYAGVPIVDSAEVRARLAALRARVLKKLRR